MKIISWNCKMAYRNKVEHIQKYNPNIVIIPECEKFGEQQPKRLWVGDSPKKGLGVFSYSTFELELYEKYNPTFRYVMPIKINGQIEFYLLAVWAMNDSKDFYRRYIGQVWLAINYYKELLDKPIVIMGDFNWNIIWDNKARYPLYGTLSDVINLLEGKNIESSYHLFYREEFGTETRHTLFMHHKQNKPYHVDYCFASGNFKIKNVEIGSYSDWIKMSDHVPIIVSFND